MRSRRPLTLANVGTKMMRALINAVLLYIPLLLATPGAARAYADPGTGAFLYQAIYAFVLAGAFYLRRFLNRIGGRKDKSE